MKTWTEKLNDPTRPFIKVATRTGGGVIEGQQMLIPTARQVDDYVRGLPRGAIVDVGQARHALAQASGAEVTCPVTIGYHLRTVAEAALEAREMGAELDEITPFWRAIGPEAPTAGRLRGGVDFIRERRAAEQGAD